MNTRQLQYAIELSKSLNFSQVADKLGISQPALSKQILNLEKELGIKLFDRNTVPLTLTHAGEYFLSEAERLLLQEDMLLRSLENFKSGKRGQITIGISPFRSQYLIPKVAKKFKGKYPDVQIILHEAGSDQLRKETADGKYDFAIVNLPVDETVLDVIPIEPDILVLAVPKDMAEGLSFTNGTNLPQINLKDCKELPFITVGKNQEMRRLLEKSCAIEDFKPKIAMEVVGISTTYAMCLEGIGAALLPLQYVKHFGRDNNISLFSLKHSVYTRQPVIVTRRGQYISESAEYAIRLLTEQTTISPDDYL